MASKPKIITRPITCVAELPGEYLTAGVTYNASHREGGKLVNFRRLDDSSGTSIPMWQFKHGLASGALVA